MDNFNSIKSDENLIYFLFSHIIPGGGAEKQILIQAQTLIENGYNIKFLCKTIDTDHFKRYCPSGNYSTSIFKHLLFSKEYCLFNFLSYDLKYCIFFSIFKKIKWIPFEQTHPNYYRFYSSKYRIIRIIKFLMLKYFYLIFAHSIFTQTDDAKEQWSKIFGKSNKNIFVLSNIFELNNKIKSYDNLSNCSEFKIVMAGRLINLKDYEFAIKSFSILSHKYNKNFKVYINGDGELLNSLKELTIKLKLDEIILFKKFNDNIQETFLNSDLFIMTSKIEGMPNALGEAMSCGLACLTLDFPGAKDLLNFKDDFTRQQIILEREVNHFANILNEITNNHCNLKKLGSMNKERIKLHFSKENFLENFSKTFNENIR